MDTPLSEFKRKHLLMAEFLRKNNKYTQNIKEKSDSMYIEITGKKPVQGIYKLRWISDNKYIEMIGRRNPIPESMIKDYFNKYPPTHTFKPSDFDIQNILRHELYRYFNIISDAEELRNPDDGKSVKHEEYLGVVGQCHAEHIIRVMIGECNEGKVGCPLAFTYEDEDRERGYQELRNKADNTDTLIDPKDTPDGYKCEGEDYTHSYHQKAMDDLDLTLDQLMEGIKNSGKWQAGDVLQELMPQLPH